MARKSANRIDIDRFRVPVGGKRFRLKDVDPGSKHGLPDRERAERDMVDDVARIDVLQELMYAQGKHALLCIFQAVDCGGKDGTIRKVFGDVDPMDRAQIDKAGRRLCGMTIHAVMGGKEIAA